MALQVSSGRKRAALAEKIAAEVANCLGISHAAGGTCRVRKAAGISFEVVHRREVPTPPRQRNTGPDDGLRSGQAVGQSDHTLDNVFSALDSTFVRPVAADAANGFRRLRRARCGHPGTRTAITRTGDSRGTDGHRPPGVSEPDIRSCFLARTGTADEETRVAASGRERGCVLGEGPGCALLGELRSVRPESLESRAPGSGGTPALFRPPLSRVREHRKSLAGFVRRYLTTGCRRLQRTLPRRSWTTMLDSLEQCLK